MRYLGAQPTSTSLNQGALANDFVTEAMMANDAIGLPELKSGIDGELITWDASGNPAAVAVGTSGHFLKSQGAGNVPVFAEVSAGGGLVKQMQTVAITGTDSTTSTSRADITSFTLTVTSLISSDKVLLTGLVNVGTNNSDYASFIHLDRAGTEIGQGAAASSRRRVHSGEFVSNNVIVGVPISFLDSPSASGDVVYKVQFSTETGSTTYVNRSGSDADNASKARSVSTLTALVIDGS